MRYYHWLTGRGVWRVPVTTMALVIASSMMVSPRHLMLTMLVHLTAMFVHMPMFVHLMVLHRMIRDGFMLHRGRTCRRRRRSDQTGRQQERQQDAKAAICTERVEHR